MRRGTLPLTLGRYVMVRWKELPGRVRRELTAQIAERDGWVCQLCGLPISHYPLRRRDQLTADHIIPESRGGVSTIENLRAAHWGCNSARGNKMARRIIIYDRLREVLST